MAKTVVDDQPQKEDPKRKETFIDNDDGDPKELIKLFETQVVITPVPMNDHTDHVDNGKSHTDHLDHFDSSHTDNGEG
jgi:hypothetical protein